jgi:hypothetical protein
MDAPSDIGQHATGISGVVVAALLSFREGWRPVACKAAAGLVAVWALGGLTRWASAKYDIPSDALGFFVGAVGVQAFTKIMDTIQQIERWTGAKAPASHDGAAS